MVRNFKYLRHYKRGGSGKMKAHLKKMKYFLKKRTMKKHIELPRDHFVHLKELAYARKEKISDTALFLIKFSEFSDENWLPGRYGGDPAEMHLVPFGEECEDIDKGKLMMAIQSLPRWIKSKTDGPINENYSFEKSTPVLPSVTTRGRTFFDLTPVGVREKHMYRLLKDTFPKAMSIDEFQILSFCQSQYVTLLDEPDRYVMPKMGDVCVDAGSFIGYKAMAMADLVGKDGEVFALELDDLNFE